MNTPGNYNEDAELPRAEVHLSEYWNLLVNRRRLIALCVGLALVVGVIAAMFAKPTYQASTVLHVEREKGTLLDVGAGDQFGSFDPEYLPTQMRLMKSREIAERVVQKLRLAANRDFNPRRPGDTGPGPDKELARNASQVQRCLSASTIRGTSLVELSCSTATPQLASDIANATAEAYIDWNLESKFHIVGLASQFIGTQIEQIKGELEEKERELLAYGREKDIVSVDPRTNVTLQKLETLNRDYAGAVTDRVTKEAQYFEVRNASPEAVASSLSNGAVSAMTADLSRLERDYAEKLNLFKPEWPAMEQLKIQIDRTRSGLKALIEDTVTKARESARAEYTTAQRREDSLRSVLQTQKSEAMTLNTNAVEYNNLKIEVETKRSQLDSLLKKQADTDVMSRLRGERVSSIRVVDRAQPPSGRSTPSLRKNLVMALALGGLAGVGLAFFLSYLDRSLRTAEQVELYIGVPTLGVIPALGTGPRDRKRAGVLRSLGKGRTAFDPDLSIELMPHREPRSAAAEAYRAFRTAVLLSRAGGVRSLVVTSCLPEEGKSATAVNLAVVLTQLGKRVLMVDADLHRPRLHEIFQVPNKVGLVSVLAEGVEPSLTIVRTNLPGISLVPAGPVSPNPSGLLSSEAMVKFLELAQMNFDYVIVDTPPLFPVSDALVFAEQLDGVVLCVAAGRTPRELVLKARERLRRSRAAILGVLLNRLDLGTSPRGYSEAYGYGYYGDPDAGPSDEPRAAQTG
jgi:capsular exopolysaccharide synthesis family protein